MPSDQYFERLFKERNTLATKSSPDRTRIWKLQDTVDFWGVNVDKPPFATKRCAGDVEGDTKPVHLATSRGILPSRPYNGMLTLHEWGTEYCFWTLNFLNRNYVVQYFSRSSFGPHWRCWLGVRDGCEDKPIAFPISVSLHGNRLILALPTVLRRVLVSGAPLPRAAEPLAMVQAFLLL